MAYMAYNQRSGIKITGMDPQHDTLEELIGTMEKGIAEGKASEVQNRILGEFLDYLDYHFQKEGVLIKNFGYADFLLEYEKDQKALKTEMAEIRQRLKNHTFTLDNQTVPVVKSLFKRHMISSEKYLVRRTAIT